MKKEVSKVQQNENQVIENQEIKKVQRGRKQKTKVEDTIEWIPREKEVLPIYDNVINKIVGPYSPIPYIVLFFIMIYVSYKDFEKNLFYFFKILIKK